MRLTPGMARWLLIIAALTVVTGTGLVLCLTGKVTGAAALGAIVGTATTVLGATLNAAGARQQADAAETLLRAKPGKE